MDISDLPLAQRLSAALALQRAAYLAHPVPTLERAQGRPAHAAALRARAPGGARSTRSAPTTATARATRRCWPRSSPAVDGIDHALKHLTRWMKPQRRARRLAQLLRRAQPRDPAAAGRGGRDRAVELSAQPEPGAADLHLRRRQPRDGQDERELAPPGRAADRASMPAYFPPEKLQFFDETGGVGIEFSQAALRPPAVHRLGPDRPRGDGRGGAATCAR